MRYGLFAFLDCLGEGLMANVRRLEEEAKEFFDEVDNVNIVGTYITARGFSRALSSTFGAYASTAFGIRPVYFGASLVPLFMAIFSLETFFELPVHSKGMDDDREDEFTISNHRTNFDIKEALQTVTETVKIHIVWVHMGLVILTMILPVGDIAHTRIFLGKINSFHPELILLVYIYHSVITYGILIYLVTKSADLRKKYLAAGGLICLLISTLPSIFLTPQIVSSTALILLSTLYHLFAHLGQTLLLVVFFSILLPYVSRPFFHLGLVSAIFKACSLLQSPIETLELSLLNVREDHGFVNLGRVAAVYWIGVGVATVLYLMTVPIGIDRRIEESLILVKYHEVKRNGDEEEIKKFKACDELFDNNSNDDEEEENEVKHF